MILIILRINKIIKCNINKETFDFTLTIMTVIVKKMQG